MFLWIAWLHYYCAFKSYWCFWCCEPHKFLVPCRTLRHRGWFKHREPSRLVLVTDFFLSHSCMWSPMGLILGPILFSLFFPMGLIADDTVIYVLIKRNYVSSLKALLVALSFFFSFFLNECLSHAFIMHLAYFNALSVAFSNTSIARL